MITDDREPAANRKGIPEARKGPLERFELPVHRDPHRLEQTGEVLGSGSGAEHRPNRVDQVITRGEPRSGPPTDDLSGKSPAPPLIAKIPKPVGQLLWAGPVEQVGGAGALLPHSHIERRPGPEREAPVGLVELARGNPEVEENELGLEVPDRGERFFAREGSGEVTDPIGSQPFPRGADGLGITIDREDVRAGIPERTRMTAIAESAVHDASRAARDVQDFREEDRAMEPEIGIRLHEYSRAGVTKPPSGTPDGGSTPRGDGADGARTRDLRSDSAAL